VRKGKCTIGIVDDDDSVRDSLRGLLEAYGYRAIDYSTSAAFLATGNAERYDCLLLDLNMPHLSGFELLMRLRAETAVTMPVVIIIGQGGDVTRRRVLATGADAFLEKPFDGDELLETIERLTGIRRIP
jgi:two-component system response regulator FixJ